METKVTEIRNLTQARKFDNDLIKFKLTKNGNGVKVVAEDLTAEIMKNFAKTDDNIQVTWTEGNAAKTYRAVGGTLAVDGTTATISNLLDVSKYYFGLMGQLKIGTPNAATLSVRIGNLKPPHDWIIDFSDKEDDAPGSEIKLQSLIDWIKLKNKEQGADLVLPEIKKPNDDPDKPIEDEPANKLDPNDFTIEFHKFYYNISQKTFDFWVASKEGETLAIGDFTLTKVGFRVTNVPISLPTAETPKIENSNGKAEELEAKDGDDLKKAAAKKAAAKKAAADDDGTPK